MKILVVDDEKLLVKGIKFNLENEGYQVDCCYDGEEAVAKTETETYDLVILDLMMPKMDGLQACMHIREKSMVPIIMLTAKSEDTDKVLGLDVGADDYITKPFNPMEVLARVKSQLRRYLQLGAAVTPASEIVCGSVAMNDREKTVTVDGEPVSLTPTEYEILKLFISHPGQVFSMPEIYRQVWKETPVGAEGTVAVHIRHLREKIEIDPANPRCLQVVWGQGYKFISSGRS